MIERQPMTIRTATDADAERIAALFTDEGYPAGPERHRRAARRVRFAAQSRDRRRHDGEVLGFVALHALPRFEQSDRIVRIMALVVDAGVRERGIGRLLMEAAERMGASSARPSPR